MKSRQDLAKAVEDFRPYCRKLRDELADHVQRHGLPQTVEQNNIRQIIRSVLEERRVLGASQSLTLALAHLKYLDTDTFSIEYRRTVAQLSERQLSLADLSKEAFQLYLDLNDYRDKLAKNETFEFFSLAFGKLQPTVFGALSDKKSILLQLEQPETADALIHALCDEAALVEKIQAHRSEKTAIIQRLCESIGLLVKDLAPATITEIAERIGIGRTTLNLILNQPQSATLTIKGCQDVLQRLELSLDKPAHAMMAEKAPFEPATVTEDDSLLSDEARRTQNQLISAHTLSGMGKEEFAEAIHLPNKKSIYRLLKGEASEAAYAQLQELLTHWLNLTHPPAPTAKMAVANGGEQLTADSAEDVAHSAMSIILSAVRMLEAAGKSYEFPHELQIKALNTSKLLRRVALQGAKEEDVVEGRPLSTSALEVLTGRH